MAKEIIQWEKPKLKIVARNYEWDCGDGCCSESKRQLIYFDEGSSVEFDELYNTSPPETKDEMIYYLQNSQRDICKKYLEEGFEFVHTTDEYDLC